MNPVSRQRNRADSPLRFCTLNLIVVGTRAAEVLATHSAVYSMDAPLPTLPNTFAGLQGLPGS